jgi:hypothetical protein
VLFFCLSQLVESSKLFLSRSHNLQTVRYELFVIDDQHGETRWTFTRVHRCCACPVAASRSSTSPEPSWSTQATRHPCVQCVIIRHSQALLCFELNSAEPPVQSTRTPLRVFHIVLLVDGLGAIHSYASACVSHRFAC